jgi:hypothetical protein
MRLAQYVPYSEFNNGKPSTLDEFRSELGAFARRGILHLCSVMNALLRSEPETINQRAHDALVKAFFNPHIAYDLLRKQGDVRFVFHRQQILFVAKSAVLYCQDEGLAATPPNFKRLGKIFLMAGDHLPTLQPKPEPLDDKFAFFASQFLPLQEASGFHRFDHKVARSYRTLSNSAPRLSSEGPYWDVPGIFEEVTNVPLLTFQSLLFGSLVKFHTFDPQAFQADPRSYGLNNAWFRSTKISADLIDRFLALVSATPSEFQSAFQKTNQGPSDFTPFRDRPLFRDDGYLFLIDFAFLAEKFETAPFWTVHNSLQNKANKDGFHAFWGRVFERYGCDLLREATAHSKNLLYESPTFKDQSKGQVCDAIIVCGSAAAFVELKGATFSSLAKYGGDYLQLKSELDKKLVQDTDGSAKAVLQLKRAIDLTCSESPEPINGIDLDHVRYVFPVVVTRDDIGSTFGVNAFLQVRFDTVIWRHNMQKIVTPLFCMNAEDFERLTPYLNDTLFTDLLDAYYQANKKRGAYFLNSYFMNENAILKEKGMRKPESLEHFWQDLSNSGVEHLGLRP